MRDHGHSEEGLLRQEAFAFSRYLLDGDPLPKMVERYASANRALLSESASPADRQLLKFSLAHRWAIPFLDAASAFLRPDSLLRRKIYIMAAILEACPRFADRFLPGRTHPVALAFRLASWGALAAVKVALGIPLWLLANRGRK